MSGADVSSPGDRDVARLVALLGSDPSRAMTIAELREHGIEAPAQAIYELQLAGWQVDRVPVTQGDGAGASGYRLSSESLPGVTVQVRHTLRGRWEVVVSDARRGIMCETLDDARRIAYLAVAHARPCELIVLDAYHRVTQRELIEGREQATARPPDARRQTDAGDLPDPPPGDDLPHPSAGDGPVYRPAGDASRAPGAGRPRERGASRRSPRRPRGAHPKTR